MKTSNPVYNRCQSAQVPRLVVALCVLPVNMSSQDDFVSSQGSNMDEEQMQAMEASAIPNSTSRATKHGVKKFDEWAAKRKIEVFFHAISAEELAAVLRKFYAEVKQQNGKMLSPSSMTGIRAALNRFVNGSPFYRNFDIVAGPDFIAANKMFDARCKLYYKLVNKKPQHKPVIEQRDMGRLKVYFSSWAKNPVVLQEVVWFSLCYFFGRRGREGWAELKKDTFTVERDPNGASYITCYCTEAIKNVQGGHRQSDQDYSDNRMYCVLCTVRQLEFIISH